MNEKQLLNYIKHEVDLKNNLPVYSSSLMDIECQTAASAFLINFAAYFDQIREYKGTESEEIERRLSALCTLTFRKPDQRGRQWAQEIEALREMVREDMVKLYAYVSYYQLHEHILNRLTYPLKPEKYQDPEIFFGTVRSYIVSETDTVKANERILDVLSEIPVRMTKSRYLDMLSDSYKAYKGVRSDILYDALALTRSLFTSADEALLDKEAYPEYAQMAVKLSEIDYKQLDEEDALTIAAELEYYAVSISGLLAVNMQLLELLGSLLVRALCEEKVSDQIKGNLNTIDGLLGGYANIAVSEGITFTEAQLLEGMKQVQDKTEYRQGMKMMMEEILSDTVIRQQHLIGELGLREDFDILIRSMKLSGPLSISAKVTGEAPYPVSEEELSRQIAELENTCRAVLDAQAVPVRRALISGSFSQLIVMFTSLEEILKFIRSSFESCKDEKEWQASANIILDMIKDN